MEHKKKRHVYRKILTFHLSSLNDSGRKYEDLLRPSSSSVISRPLLKVTQYIRRCDNGNV